MNNSHRPIQFAAGRNAARPIGPLQSSRITLWHDADAGAVGDRFLNHLQVVEVHDEFDVDSVVSQIAFNLVLDRQVSSKPTNASPSSAWRDRSVARRARCWVPLPPPSLHPARAAPRRCARIRHNSSVPGPPGRRRPLHRPVPAADTRPAIRVRESALKIVDSISDISDSATE